MPSLSRLGGLVVWAALGIALGTSAVAFASSASVSSNKLSAGSSSIPRCDSDGITVVENLSGANVVSVTVGSISSSCAAGTLAVAVDNLSASSSGTAAVPAGGGSVTVTLSSAVAAKDVERIDAVITGP